MNINTENIKEGCCVVVGLNSGISSKNGKPYKTYHVIKNVPSANTEGYIVESIFDNSGKNFDVKVGDICLFMFLMNGTFKQGIGHVEKFGNINKK